MFSQVTRRAPGGRSSGLTWRSKYSSTSSRTRPPSSSSSAGVTYRIRSPSMAACCHSRRLARAGLQPARQLLEVLLGDDRVQQPGRRRPLRACRPRSRPSRSTSWSPATASPARSRRRPPRPARTWPAAAGGTSRSRTTRRAARAARVAVSGPSVRSSPTSAIRTGCAYARSARGSVSRVTVRPGARARRPVPGLSVSSRRCPSLMPTSAFAQARHLQSLSSHRSPTLLLRTGRPRALPAHGPPTLQLHLRSRSSPRPQPGPRAPGRKNAPLRAVRTVVDDSALTFGPRAVPLSVLDLAPVPDGGTAAGALRATTDLAQRAERLGYHRFWVAEHHNMPGIASSAPPVLIGHIADATTTMRVGSGGVMLPNHVSLVVAEQFGMLEALHPGRIDLGIGRAPGTDQVTAAALRRSPEALSADDFPDQLMDLLGFFTGRWPENHPYAQHHRGARPGQPAGHVAARLERLQRPAGRAARPAVRLRPPLQRGQHAARAGPVPPALPPVGGPRAPVRDGRRRRDLRRDRRAGPLPGRLRRAVVPAAALRPSRPDALARGGGRLPLQRAGARLRRGPPGHPDHRLTRDRPARHHRPRSTPPRPTS